MRHSRAATEPRPRRPGPGAAPALIRRPRPVAELLAELPRPIGLLGFGVEGRATLALLRRHGIADTLVFDRNPAAAEGAEPALLDGTALHLGPDYLAALGECRTIARSPGIRPDLPELERARAAGARVTSAVRLFLAACPVPVVGVTGTLGKGTTVALLHEALEAAGRRAPVTGNYGANPLEVLPELAPGDVVLLELSSFQLMDLDTDWPEVAVVLRTTREHLDWHRDATEYRRAKARLVAPPGAGQRLICCADAEGSREVAGARFGEAAQVSLAQPVREGVGLDSASGTLARFREGTPEPLPVLERLALPGAFNRENAAAALLAAEALGAPAAQALPAIAAFAGLPHRLERCGTVGAVTCVNDSYATRPEATLGAIAAFGEAPLALILGGSEKHADFAPLVEALCGHPSLRRVLLIGATAERLASELTAATRRTGRAAPEAVRCEGLETAFAEGLAALPEGGVLLLSPACASFGLFPNYKVRGERFRALVRAAREGGPAAPGEGAP